MSIEHIEKSVEKMDKELLRDLKEFVNDVSEIITGCRETDRKSLLNWIREYNCKAAEFDKLMIIYEDGEDIGEYIEKQKSIYGN